MKYSVGITVNATVNQIILEVTFNWKKLHAMNGCWQLWQKCCSMCIAIYGFPSKSSSVWLWPRSYPPPWPIFPPKKLQKDKEHCLFIQFPPPKGINQAGCHVLGLLRYILGCMIHRLCLCHTSKCFCTSCPMKGSRDKTCLKGRMYYTM